MNKIQYCVPCLFGLEGIAGDELRRLSYLHASHYLFLQ